MQRPVPRAALAALLLIALPAAAAPPAPPPGSGAPVTFDEAIGLAARAPAVTGAEAAAAEILDGALALNPPTAWLERLKAIKADNPSKLIWQHGQGKYLIQEQYCDAFTKAFGTPNMVHRTTACEAARHVADELTWASAGILPDLSVQHKMFQLQARLLDRWRATGQVR